MTHTALPSRRTGASLPSSYPGWSSLSAILPIFGLAAVCFLLALPFSGRALAAADPAPAEPGYKQFQVGAIEVNALLDRPGGMDISLFTGPASPGEREKYMPDGKAPASISTFLIRANGKNILVDTGFGTLAPGTSLLPRYLAEAGLTPDAIDLVLLTHMHTDHIGGLLAHKKRAFAKARVLVSKPELDYWTELGRTNPANTNAALVKAVVQEYGNDILPPFEFGATVFPGIVALDASGHTPGHTVFLVESDGKRMMIIGDLIHAAALQFPLPDECASYDIDPAKAVKSRKVILTRAAAENIPVAGMHIPFPGVGGVEGTGFSFKPLP